MAQISYLQRIRPPKHVCTHLRISYCMPLRLWLPDVLPCDFLVCMHNDRFGGTGCLELQLLMSLYTLRGGGGERKEDQFYSTCRVRLIQGIIAHCGILIMGFEFWRSLSSASLNVASSLTVYCIGGWKNR